MTLIKNILFSLLMISPYAAGAMDNYKNSSALRALPALPTYAKYLNYTPRERFEGMLTEAMQTLGEQILGENGVSTADIISCKTDQLMPSTFIPETIQDKERRVALEIVIKHYAHLHRIHHILSAALSNQIPLTEGEITPHTWGKNRLDVPSLTNKLGISFWEATYIEKEESGTAIAKSETELKKTKKVICAELPSHSCLSSYKKRHYFYLDALPDKNPFEILVADSFSLRDIESALQFLSSYIHPDLPVISNFNISAGAELKSALDTILNVNASKTPNNQPMHYIGQFDNYKMKVLILKATVDALNDELLDSNITTEVRQALDIQTRIERAKYQAIEKVIEAKENEGGRLENNIFQAIEQQTMRKSDCKQMISKLKEAYELFTPAFSDGEQERVLYNQKRFFNGIG